MSPDARTRTKVAAEERLRRRMHALHDNNERALQLIKDRHAINASVAGPTQAIWLFAITLMVGAAWAIILLLDAHGILPPDKSIVYLLLVTLLALAAALGNPYVMGPVARRRAGRISDGVLRRQSTIYNKDRLAILDAYFHEMEEIERQNRPQQVRNHGDDEARLALPPPEPGMTLHDDQPRERQTQERPDQ